MTVVLSYVPSIEGRGALPFGFAEARMRGTEVVVVAEGDSSSSPDFDVDLETARTTADGRSASSPGPAARRGGTSSRGSTTTPCSAPRHCSAAPHRTPGSPAGWVGRRRAAALLIAHGPRSAREPQSAGAPLSARRTRARPSLVRRTPPLGSMT